jgi:hypothetical protein
MIPMILAITMGAIFPVLAEWNLDPAELQVENGVSNQRWIEEDGTYAQNCVIWLDPAGEGVYRCYTFNEDGYMRAAAKYRWKINAWGQRLNADGSVMEIVVPQDTLTITTADYSLRLPENWINHYCYLLKEGQLYVYFYPMSRNRFQGRLGDSVFQTMFIILKFDSAEAMERTRRQGMVDNWRYLGKRDGCYYVYGGRTDSAIGAFTAKQRQVIESMEESLDPGSLLPALEN